MLKTSQGWPCQDRLIIVYASPVKCTTSIEKSERGREMLGCEKKGLDIVLKDPLTPLNNTKDAGKMCKVLGDVYKQVNNVERMMQ